MAFPVDEKFIIETEVKLNLKFPEDYRISMMKMNGGVMKDEWILIPFYDTSDKTRIKRTCNDICRENNLLHQSDFFPKNAIAIAEDGEGNYLVFVKEENKTELKENIFLWHHEAPDELEEVASNFSELNFSADQ